MPITNRDLPAGTVLTATYKKQPHRARVLIDDAGKPGYELDGATIFKSLSAAGSAVMGGVACNGWRFWSVEGEEPEHRPSAPKGTRGAQEAVAAAVQKAIRQARLRQIRKLPNQKGTPEGQTKFFCSACQQAFLLASPDVPEACPAGHAREVEDELAPVS
jgi:hypothetical protein